MEYKFRAWDKINKKMVLVAGFHNVIDHDYDEPERDISDKIQKIAVFSELPCVEKFFWQDADRYELMQYTGLKDKNGKDIFGGDIIRYTFKTQGGSEVFISPVVFDESMWLTDEHSLNRCSECEVIGNVYDEKSL